MANPVKIFELKGEDFAKGLSYFTDFPFAGNMREVINFDPFLDYGYFTPSLGGTTISNATSTPKFITSWNDSGTAKLYVHTNDKLYEILDGSPYTVTDKTAQIDVTQSVTGAISFKGRYVYNRAADAKTFSNVYPVASGSNVEILSSGATSEHYKPMAIAPDKNLYVCDGAQINQITSVTGTGGNTATYYSLETGMIARDLVNDGHYLVVVADNNTSHTRSAVGNTGSNRCLVLFYDVNNGRSTADYIYEFTDSYISSVKVLDGAVYIFGKDNLWVCNSQTPPKAIFNFQTGSTITEPPQYPYQVHQRNNVIYWCGQTNSKIYAFGSKVAGAKKVFFQPFSNSAQPTCILTSGNNVYIGSNGSSQMLRLFNASQTKSSASFTTCYFNLEQPYTFAYAKIVCKTKLVSGESVSFGMSSLVGEITDLQTKTYTQIGAKQSIIFNKASDAGNPPVANFNEFNLSVESSPAISKIEVWGYPVDNHDQTV
jgi:hypothetical protein